MATLESILIDVVVQLLISGFVLLPIPVSAVGSSYGRRWSYTIRWVLVVDLLKGILVEVDWPLSVRCILRHQGHRVSILATTHVHVVLTLRCQQLLYRCIVS